MATKRTIKEQDLPATRGMLTLVRDELKSDIRSLEHKMDSRFQAVDARFEQIDARFEQIDARFEQIDARFLGMDSKLSSMDSKLASMEGTLSRMHLLIEEQHANNKVVFEALQAIAQRQDRQESRLDQVDETVRGLAKSKCPAN